MTLTPVTAEHAGRPAHDGRIGIIDIGSNSMRLVIYDGIKRSPLPLFNEKVFCGLGKGLAITGKLNPHGVEMAEATMPRFLAMARLMDVVELDIFATAAVRDASNGKAFLEQMEKRHHIRISLISGKHEARLGALGIVASMHNPQGLSGDLGGGSMELCLLSGTQLSEQATLPIGSLRLIDEGKGSRDKTRKIIERAFHEQSWLGDCEFPHFYAIGGSFRALAKLHMLRTSYPLKILHQYSVKADEMLALAKYVSNLSVSELAKVPGVSGKRAAALMPAALILEYLIRHGHIADVVFSTHGIREGYLFEKLSPHVRKDDGLISACADMAAQAGTLTGYGRELFHWMGPLFRGETEAEHRLRLAACLLSEIAWRVHPEYRADWAFQTVLQSSLVCLQHHERIALATALYHRYQSKLKNNRSEAALLDGRARLWARLVGVAANLAYHLSGGECGHLTRTGIEVWKGKGELRLLPDIQDVMGDAVRKRVEGLGKTFKAFSSKAK